MPDDELIKKFLAQKSVTICPTVAVEGAGRECKLAIEKAKEDVRQSKRDNSSDELVSQ